MVGFGSCSRSILSAYFRNPDVISCRPFGLPKAYPILFLVSAGSEPTPSGDGDDIASDITLVDKNGVGTRRRDPTLERRVRTALRSRTALQARTRPGNECYRPYNVSSNTY